MTNLTVAEKADRDACIHELHAQGLPYRTIATEVGCAAGTVSNVLKKSKPTEPDTNPPGANTKPVPDTVTAALARVHQLRPVNDEPAADGEGTDEPPPTETAEPTPTALAVIDAEVVEAELIDTDTTIASIDDETGLGELAAIANHYHQIAEFAQRTSVQAAWCAGQALLKVKGIVPHGDLKRWIEANFWGSYRTAAAYMQIGKSADSAHLEMLGSPTSIDSALKAIRTSRQPRAQVERKSAEASAINKVEKSIATIESALERLDDGLNELRQLGAVGVIRDLDGGIDSIMSGWEQIDSTKSAWLEDAEAGA